MKFTETEISTGVNILASPKFKALPMAITGTEVVKAGTPISNTGAAVKSGFTNVVGVLLYDVDPKANPNGAVVTDAYINSTVAKKHSGVTLTGISAAVPGIVLRSNVGANE